MHDSGVAVDGISLTRALCEAESVAGIGSWVRGGTADMVWASPGLRRLCDLPDGEVVTREVLYELIHPDDRPTVFEGTARTFAEGDPFAARVRLITRSGHERVTQMRAERAAPLADGAVFIVGTVRDITIDVARDEQLARAARLETVGRLAGGLAHELNNVLTVLTGHAELLRSAVRSTELESVDAIEAATDRARVLTQHLVALGQREVLRPALVEVAAVVERVVDVTRATAPAGIDVNCSVERGLPPAHVDPARLEQVLFNLTLNAVDAIGEHGTIELRARIHEGEVAPLAVGTRTVRIEVIDDGPGMPPEVLERALEPFYTTKRAGEGSGLGLPTSYGIVTQSGGRLTIDSAEGRGTTVIVHLPAADQRTESSVSLVPTGRGLDGPVTILLAEDDDQLLPLIDRLLSGRGHRVLTAIDGEDAMAVAARSTSPIDLLVTDVSMPRRNGHDLAAALSAVYPRLRVIFMSGYTDNPSVRDGVATSDIHFIAKPFAFEQLLEVVDDVLARPV